MAETLHNFRLGAPDDVTGRTLAANAPDYVPQDAVTQNYLTLLIREGMAPDLAVRRTLEATLAGRVTRSRLTTGGA